jgi:hypothetical protein
VGFLVIDSPPAAFAVATTGASSHDITLNGFFADLATEPHFVLVDWGDGPAQLFFLGINNGQTFTPTHKYRKHQKPVTVTVIVFDDQVGVSNTIKSPLSFK